MKRCRKVLIVFTLIFVVMLVGCSKGENKVEVYSFSGNNDHIQITNGVIVLSEDETVFNGGNLELLKSGYSSITSCSMTFYVMSGSEKITVLSNSIEDLTGENIECLDSLGKISGNDVLTTIANEDESHWKNNLYFELTARDSDGNEFAENVQLTVVDITDN